MPDLTPEQDKKQEIYRTARFSAAYDGIWQSVGKCVFCDLNDKYVFFEENGVVMTISLYAYIDGHLMIVPRRHVRYAKDLTPLEWATIRKFTYIAKKIIKDVHGLSGMQLIQKEGSAAQSTVTDHIHFHCVPFDAPDLLTWNYRELKNTPLKNAELYKALDSKIASYKAQFDKKYAGAESEAANPVDSTSLSWSDLAFASKKPLKDLAATFIAAPRTVSDARLKQLIKTYLPKGNLVIGLSTQDFVDGFEGQPQFRTLRSEAVEALIAKVNSASPKHKIYTLAYAPADEPHIIAKDLFAHYVFINGSWQYSFHLRPTFYALAKLRARYELISPFSDEAEAKTYLESIWPDVEAATPVPPVGTKLTAQSALTLAAIVGQRSFDHTFQTGLVLAERTSTDAYKLLVTAYNAVVPYQTYSMHHGSSREQNFAPPGDLNYYDANHAEMDLLIQANRDHIDLSGTTLFINLLPCPTCARVLAATDIVEIVYQYDHSDGYAARLLTEAGKTVRRESF